MTKSILNISYYTSKFHKINSLINDWDFNRISGVGFFKKHSSSPAHYAHIELTIFETLDDYPRNYIIWKTNEKHLPEQIGHRAIVEETLSFFINHVSAIKGKRPNLTIEINNGSYHPIDTHPRDFEYATILAIINAFDKTHKAITENDMNLIEDLKIGAERNYEDYFGSKKN
jgi:hypothetical protein